MAFTVPTHWQTIGGNTDTSGSAQISRSRPIGGGGTADGQDETLILVENGRWGWTTANRAVVTGQTTYGEASPQAEMISEAGTSYVVVAQALATPGPERGDVTVLVDFIGRVKVAAVTSGAVSIDSDETANVNTQTQASISLAGSTTTDYYEISLKAYSGGVPGKLFSITVLEDISGVSTYTSGSTYEYKKIDNDAAAGLDPYGGYLLQGIAANDEAGHFARTRRSGTFWPTGAKPVLACHTTVAYPLALWPVSSGVKTISVDLRVTVSDASVYVDLAVFDLFGGGVMSSKYATTEITAGGPKTQALTIDVTRFGIGQAVQEVLLVLLVRSDAGADLGTVVYGAEANPIQTRARLDLTGHSLTFVATDRYKATISEPPSGAVEADIPFPGPVSVIALDDPHLYIWPFYAQTQLTADWANNGSTLTITKLGRVEVHSIRVVESAVEARRSLKSSLHPGHAPSAAAIKNLYFREWSHFHRRTRLHCALPNYDPADKTGSDVVSTWGAVERLDTDWAEVGSFMIRGYPTSLAMDGSTVQYRSVIRVSGLVVLCYGQRPERQMDLQVRVVLTNYSGGWTADEVVSSAVTAVIPALPPFSNRRMADLVWGNIAGVKRAFHTLRGAMDVDELASMTAGLGSFEVVVNDTETTATERLARVQVKLATAVDHEGNPINVNYNSLWIAALSCRTDEELVTL